MRLCGAALDLSASGRADDARAVRAGPVGTEPEHRSYAQAAPAHDLRDPHGIIERDSRHLGR
jgi:hypothetical protein